MSLSRDNNKNSHVLGIMSGHLKLIIFFLSGTLPSSQHHSPSPHSSPPPEASKGYPPSLVNITA